MIKLQNGAEVFRADLVERWGEARGYVLALSRGEYVTWNVQRDTQGVWHAFHGHYFPIRDGASDHAYKLAVADYDERRK